MLLIFARANLNEKRVTLEFACDLNVDATHKSNIFKKKHLQTDHKIKIDPSK